MPKKKAPVLAIPSQRYAWLEYIEQDAEDDEIAYRFRVRTNLTFGELEALTWDDLDPTANAVEALGPMFAPFVVDWNVGTLGDDGKPVPAAPPAEGGAEQFDLIPPALFWELVRDVKLRSTGPLDRTRSGRRASTADGPSESD